MDNIANIYSELYSFLNTLGDSFIKKLPLEEYSKILENKNNDYYPVYKIEDFENREIMSDKTRNIIASYHLKYWCDTEEEKNNLNKIFRENEKKLLEKYNPFKNIKRNKEYSNNECTELIKKEEDNIFKKILKVIKNIFKI